MAGAGTSTLVFGDGVSGTRDTVLTGAGTHTFTNVTLQNTNADPRARTYPEGVIGLPGSFQPLQFTFNRFIRQTFRDDLLAISVHAFAAAPRATRGSAVVDAVAHNTGAELVEFTWTAIDGVDKATSTETLWGVFQLQNVQRIGNKESGSVLVWPCNVLRFSDSTTYYADPDTVF